MYVRARVCSLFLVVVVFVVSLSFVGGVLPFVLSADEVYGGIAAQLSAQQPFPTKDGALRRGILPR